MPPSQSGGASSPGSAPQPSPSPLSQHHVLIGAVSAVILLIALLVGVELARSNADVICQKVMDTSDQGSCSNGTWTAWATTGQSTDQATCKTTYTDQRTYTGTRQSTTFHGAQVIGVLNLHQCHALGGDSGGEVHVDDETRAAMGEQPAAAGSNTGTMTSQFAACQIVETRTRVVQGTGSGAGCVPGGNNLDPRNVTSESRTETTGNVIGSAQTTSGSYDDYRNMVDAQLATSSIWAAPALLHKGETTLVYWTSDHAKSCTVTGTNGDAWPKTSVAALTGKEVSGKINDKVTYNLACTTASGKVLHDSTEVNIIPDFQEK